MPPHHPAAPNLNGDGWRALIGNAGHGQLMSAD
jgi:hypothetical protein